MVVPSAESTLSTTFPATSMWSIGARVVALQQTLADRVRKLEEALSNVKQLQGLLPMCSYCKRIRDGQAYWMQVEKYLSENSEAQFSHGICPDCLETQLAVK